MKNEKTIGKERLLAFFDAGTFVELGAYIRRPGSDDTEGVVCGYGAKDGRLVFAFSQDPSQMRGALDARHAEKIALTYQKALAVGAPIVGFFDCAGVAVFDGAAALAGYGTLLSVAAKAAGKIPQIAVISGVCAGTMAAVAALFDLTIVMKEKSLLYTASPSLVGEEIGTAEYAAKNGNAALVAASESAAFAAAGKLISYLPDRAGGNLPTYAGDDLNRALAIADGVSAADALAAAVDAGSFTALYADYSGTVTAGIAFMGGIPTVVLALDGELTLSGIKAMTRLYALAESFGLPTVTFVNCEGTAKDEQPELAVALAALAKALANGTAARVTAIVGKAIGAGFLFGGAKTLGADMVYALPGAEISTLTAKTGVAFLWNDRITAEKTREDLEKEWSEAAAPEAAAAMGEVDDIVEPTELRARVLAALMMLRDKRA